MNSQQKMINKLLRDISKMEGGKSEVAIGDLRQVIKILAGYEAAFVLKMAKENGDMDLSIEDFMSKWGDARGNAFRVLEVYKDHLLERGFIRLSGEE